MTMLVFLAFLLCMGRVAAQQERTYSPDFGPGGPDDGVTGRWNEFNFYRAERSTDKEYSNQPVLWLRRGAEEQGKGNYGYSKFDCGSAQSIIPCPEPGTRYTLKARARIAEITFSASSSRPEPANRDESPRRIFVEFSDKDGKRTIPVEFHVTEKTYQDFAKTFTVPKDAVWCRVWILCAAHRPNLYVTSVSLKSAEPDDTPKAPTGLRVVDMGSTMVRLQWNAVPGASGYRIERKASQEEEKGFKVVFVTLEGGAQTSFLDTLVMKQSGILRSGTSWDYRVSALGDNGNSACTKHVTAVLPARTDSPGNTTYYISASTGNDANNGVAPKTPWKSFVPLDKVNLAPGDRVILKQGDVWYEPLHLHGSGAAGKEIIVGPDGSSQEPTIIQAGTKAHAAISMPDVSHCKVQNLEISNWHPFYRQRYCCGLEAGTWLTPEVNNLTLDHLFVNKLRCGQGRGGSAKGFSDGGGMGIRVAGSGLRRFIEGKPGKNVKERMGWARGIRVTNCVIEDVETMGIVLTHVDDFVVSHNRTDKIGRIALLSTCLTNGVVSHNHFKRAGWYFTCGDNAHIGCYAGKHVVFEHNVIDRTINTASGQAFNFDGCDSYVVQYNYLKDSDAGSFVLNHGAPDNIFRYNICEGLTREDLRREWLRNLGGARTQVYNNTVYLRKGQTPTLSKNDRGVGGNTPVRGLLFCNNVFYNAEGLSRDEEGFQLHRATKGAEDIVITHNLYYRASDDDFRDLKDAAPVFADPLFQGPVGKGNPEAYRLKPGSLCIGAGKVVKDNGGKDFFGNPVPANAPPTMGAFQEADSR